VVAYETLRAAVVAHSPVSVAGLGVVLRDGVRAWMAVCHPPSPDHASASRRESGTDSPLEARHRELVAIWAQMAATVSAEVAHG
jgi:hypothetical protein